MKPQKLQTNLQEIYSTKWKKYGKAVGPIRNEMMIESADALVCLLGRLVSRH